MSGSIRLITDEATIHLPSIEGNFLIKQKNNYIFPRPRGKAVVVGFCQHVNSVDSNMPEVVKQCLKKDIGIVYVCDKLPRDLVIHPNITYVEVQWAWLIHTLFFNPLDFKGCFHNNHTDRIAKAFSAFTKYQIPILKSAEDIVSFSTTASKCSNNILFELNGGVGDHLLTIPVLKTLAHMGKNIFVLCEEQRLDCFKHLDYIKGFYTKRDQIDVSKFDRINWLHFGQLLNDYRLDLNKQNRIYSVANVCGLKKDELKFNTPEILLSPQEGKEASLKWKFYPKKIFFGWDSNRPDTRIPPTILQNMIDKLKRQGFTVFTSSLRDLQLTNCINLSGKLNLRQLFSLIASMDVILTVDSSFLHIAGAFPDIPTFCLMNYFEPHWRTSTYKNVKSYTPNVSCFPCVAKQWCPPENCQCRTNSCFSFFDWDTILKDISELNLEHKTLLNCTDKYHILVESFDGIGDILMSIPSVYTLHKKGHTIDYYIDSAYKKDIFKHLPFVGNVYCKQDRFDISQYDKRIVLSYKLSNYSLEHNRQHRVYASAYHFGFEPKDLVTIKPILELDNTEKKYGKDMLSKYKNTVVIARESVSKARTLCYDTTQELIDTLVVKGYTPIIVGAWKVGFTNCVNLSNQLNLRQLFSVIYESSYVISTDTGILHIAGALNKKTVFLPSSIPGEWRIYEGMRMVEPTIECYPCWDFQKKQENLCNNKFPACFRTITVKQILEELKNL